MSYVKQIIQQRYKDSFHRFFTDAWHVVEPEQKLVNNWHIKYLCQELQKIYKRVAAGLPCDYHTIFNVPPSSTKSTIITIMFPVWCWLGSPWMKFITASYAENLALIHATKSRDVIVSDWFQDLFGDLFQLKYDVNKKSEYQNDKGGARIAIGVLGGATGKHADIFICDDSIDPRRAASEGELLKVNSWWDGTVSTRLTNPDVSAKVIVMQRLAANDLTGHCLKTKVGQYRLVRLPAELTKDVEPPSAAQYYIEGLLDPVRLSLRVLSNMRVALGSAGYAGQYLQTPSDMRGNLAQRAWFKTFQLSQLDDIARQAGEDVVWHLFIDGAYTENKLNAPTALLAACYLGADMYIRDAARVWMELPDLIRHIPEFAARNGCNTQSKIYIEPKASGLSAAQMLRQYTTLNVVLGKAPTKDKVTRFKAALPYLESGRAHVLEEASWLAEYLDEVTTFPFSTYKDLVDVTSMAVQHGERGGVDGSSILIMQSI